MHAVRLSLAICIVGLAPACAADPTASCIAEKLEPGLSVIGRMEADKLDLKRPRLVSQLFFGEDGRLLTLQRRLASVGWPAVKEGPGRLLASAMTPTDRRWIEQNTRAMCAVAAATGVEYDGWDVDVAADNITSKAR